MWSNSSFDAANYLSNFLLQTLEDEMRARRPKALKIEQFGRGLVEKKHPDSPKITEYVDTLANGWKQLDKMVAERRKQLQDAAEAYSVGGCVLLLECLLPRHVSLN